MTQLVPDLTGFLRSTGRLLAPGGRLVIVPAGPPPAGDEIGDIVRPMSEALRPRRDAPETIAAAAGGAGLRVAATATGGSEDVWHASPTQEADQIEARSWSTLWDLTDDAWDRHVVPAVAALRALPDPDRVRTRPGRFEVVVLEPGPPTA